MPNHTSSIPPELASLVQRLGAVLKLVKGGHLDFARTQQALDKLILFGIASSEFTVTETLMRTGKKIGPYTVTEDCLFPRGRLKIRSLVRAVDCRQVLSFTGLQQRAKETNSFLGVSHAEAFVDSVSGKLYHNKVIVFPATVFTFPNRGGVEEYFFTAFQEDGKWALRPMPTNIVLNANGHKNFYLLEVEQIH